MKVDVHSHFYPAEYVATIRRLDSEKGSKVTDINFPLWKSAGERIFAGKARNLFSLEV